MLSFSGALLKPKALISLHTGEAQRGGTERWKLRVFICVNGFLSVNVRLIRWYSLTGSMLYLHASAPYPTCSLCLNYLCVCQRWISLCLAWPEQCVPDLAMSPWGQQPGLPHITAVILCCHQLGYEATFASFSMLRKVWKRRSIQRGRVGHRLWTVYREPKKGIFRDTQVDLSSSFPTIRSSHLLINGLRCRLRFLSSERG